MIKVYIASPYTVGDTAINVRDQLVCADKLIDAGFAPFAPLYSHFQHMFQPRPYEDWAKLDNEWVLVCDALLRLPGESAGADAEIELAKQNNIPVFYDLDSLLEYFAEETEDEPGISIPSDNKTFYITLEANV